MKKNQIEGSPIIYYVSGKEHNEWVLFLHAAFVNHKMFQAQFDYFKSKHNIMLLDIIGHGQSTKTKKGDSIDKMPRWIYDILKVEKIELIHIVGVSLGSVLAQDFANHYPKVVKSLACFGGYDINNFDVKMQKENRMSQVLMMLKAIFSIKWFSKANKMISAYSERAQQEFYEMNILFSKKSFVYLSTLSEMVNKHKQQARNYPLMIGCGEYDVPLELKAIKKWQNNEPTCTVKVFENAGHCVNMDVPQAFNTAIEDFWIYKN